MKRTLLPQHLFAIMILASIVWLPVGTERSTHADQNAAGALSDEATATLSSLEKVDDLVEPAARRRASAGADRRGFSRQRNPPTRCQALAPGGFLG